MQVNTGPVSQDGQGQGSDQASMMSRPYDSKSMAIDSQLLQSAHHADDQAQALAAAAAQQSDRSTEYAIQQLQGYSGMKDEHQHHAQHHGHPGSMASHHQHHAQHHHHGGHDAIGNPNMAGALQGGLGAPNGLGGAGLGGAGLGPNGLGPNGLGGSGLGPNGLGPNGLGPNGLGGNGLGGNGLGGNVGVHGYVPSGANQPKPAVGSEEYYRIKKYNHKEVERRRRETINKGIDDLGKVVPDCDKHKGQILARAVDYIKMLKDKEETLMKQLTLEKLISEQSINELSSTNKSLKAELAQAWKELDHYKRQAERQAE